MKKLTDTIKLMAKTGLFFAHADGTYDDRERQFIEDFVGGIEQIADLDAPTKYAVGDTINHTYTLDEIIDETRQLLDQEFNDQERVAILRAIKSFINRVIRIDGVIHKQEDLNFKAWKQALGVE